MPQCPTCGSTVSEQAEVCPDCGMDLKSSPSGGAGSSAPSIPGQAAPPSGSAPSPPGGASIPTPSPGQTLIPGLGPQGTSTPQTPIPGLTGLGAEGVQQTLEPASTLDLPGAPAVTTPAVPPASGTAQIALKRSGVLTGD